jgi:hypothetical protein
MNSQQRLAVFGAISLIRLHREQIDRAEEDLAKLLEFFGARKKDPRADYDTVLGVVQDWCIDDRFDAEEITDRILEELEFEDA